MAFNWTLVGFVAPPHAHDGFAVFQQNFERWGLLAFGQQAGMPLKLVRKVNVRRTHLILPSTVISPKLVILFEPKPPVILLQGVGRPHAVRRPRFAACPDPVYVS